MPRKPPAANPKTPAASRKRPARATAVRATAVPATQASRWRSVLIVAVLAVSAGAYQYRDRIPRPTIVASTDQQLARQVAVHHSQLLISEIIVPLRKSNDGKLTNEQALQVWKTALPVIQRHTLAPLTDRMTQLQTVDKDGKPTGLMDREALSRCLDDWESGLK